MPRYELECDGCGERVERVMSFAEYDEAKQYPLLHGTKDGMCGTFHHVLSFSVIRSMPAHFNTSLGQYVTNQAAADSALSRASDETSARMGFDHRFEFIDPTDAAAAGVSEAGLESTRQREVDSGRVEPKLIL